MTILPLAKVRNHWLASLELDLTHSPFGTQLTRTKRQGPLSVQKAFYPEGKDCAHLYLLHPPAGIVSGDELTVSLYLKKEAHGLITTPGANRFYRAREDHSIGDAKQLQSTNIKLDNQAKCEHFPLETIVYENAEAVNNVDIQLHEDSVYCGWDITCLGLPSSSQPFKSGRFTQLNRVFCNQQLIYHDRISVRPESEAQHHIAGLNKQPVFGTFLAYASDQLVNNDSRSDLVQQLRDKVNQLEAEKLVSVTHVKQLIIIRYLGQHAEECKGLFIQLWKLLRPVYLQKEAVAPRIWHT